jgi:ABC-2 type transport system ATP-binding protein
MHQGRLLFSDTPTNLKQRLSGTVLAVLSREPRRVRDALRASPAIASLVMTGDGVHLVLKGTARASREEVRGRLLQAGVPFDDVVPATASIEDLFVNAVSALQP